MNVIGKRFVTVQLHFVDIYIRLVYKVIMAAHCVCVCVRACMHACIPAYMCVQCMLVYLPTHSVCMKCVHFIN